jgi:hypothetical protein
MKRELRGKKFQKDQEIRQTVCSTFSRSGWNVVRNVSLAKGGTSKKRPSPHLHKVPTRSNKVSPRTYQTAHVESQQINSNQGLIRNGGVFTGLTRGEKMRKVKWLAVSVSRQQQNG